MSKKIHCGRCDKDYYLHESIVSKDDGDVWSRCKCGWFNLIDNSEESLYEYGRSCILVISVP